MTHLLREVRPEELLRAGALFGEVAEVLGDTAVRCQASGDVSWVGPPTWQYKKQLHAVVRDLRRMQGAYDEACDALLSYSRALEPVRELAVQADLLDAHAGDLQVRSGQPVSIGVFLTVAPEVELARSRAAVLRREAEEREHTASTRLAAVLMHLAELAPHNGGWSRAAHSASDFVTAATGSVRGTFSLAGDAYLSLPMMGTAAERAAARRRLWEAAGQMAKPWLAVEDALARLRDHEYATLAGEVVPSLVLRSRVPLSRRTSLFGWHDDLPLPVMRALRLSERAGPLEETRAWVDAHANREFLEQAKRFAGLPAPSVDALLRDGVDLVQQEALGGHTIYKHVGRDVEFLRRRQLLEAKPGKSPLRASSFLDQAEAELLINRALRQPASLTPLRELASGVLPEAVLTLRADAIGHGVLLAPTGTVVQTRFVVVEFKRRLDGSVFLNRAFLEDRG